jgi:O-antigen/teichoic acid export membrane protein
MSSLRVQTIRGVIWHAFETFGGQLIQLIITIILARILVPEDFGILGLLIIFTELSKVILDSGFSQTLIRKKDANQNDFTSVFYFNVCIGLTIYLALYLCAPLISNFYNFPKLTSISRVVFLSIVINSFSIVQNAKIIKEVQFNILAKRTIISNLIAGIIGITLALQGFGVWSLVAQVVFASLFRGLLLWIYSKWRPSLHFSLRPILEMLPFSINLLISGIFDVLVTNIQTLLIGKFYSKKDLGYYTQARRIEGIPSSSLTSIVRTVTFPVLTNIQDDVDNVKLAYRKIIQISFFFVFPLMLGLISMADNLIISLLGDQWKPSIGYFRILCITGAIFPLYSINLNIFLVRGKSKLYLKVNILKRIFTLISIILTVTVSVYAIVWGQVIASIVNTIITMIYSGREINYKFFAQLKDLYKVFIVSIIMALVIYILGSELHILNRFLLLSLQFLVAITMYYFLALIFKIEILHDLKVIFKEVRLKLL